MDEDAEPQLGPVAQSLARDLRPLRPRSLAEQAASAIVDGIAVGALQPGQKLIEAEVAQRLDVSRVPVREALKILETQGILISRPRRGVRVAEFDNETARQVYEVRVALEKVAVRELGRVGAARPELGKALDAIIERMGACLRHKDLLGVSKADLAFHRTICQASGNKIALTLWEALARHMLIVFQRELLADPDRVHIVDHHRELRKALTDDPQNAERQIERHIMRLMRKSSGDGVDASSGPASAKRPKRRLGTKPQ
jgi:DNA-binding GntR family transcriptional regulator